LKYYKDDGKRSIDSNNSEEISLNDALKEIDNLPAVEGNFIGFINEKEESIQFLRFEDDWLLDAPILKNGKFVFSLQDDDLTTEKVKKIIESFYLGQNWQSICNLTKTS
jgi:hypothetical protein